MSEFPSQQNGARSAPSSEECAVAREALECGVLLATRAGDARAFERAVAQLRPYYEASSSPPGAGAASETAAAAVSRRLVLGLWLLHLLAAGAAGRPRFHSEVELLSADDRASPHLAFVLRLESFFSEGAYNRVRVRREPRARACAEVCLGGGGRRRAASGSLLSSPMHSYRPAHASPSLVRRSLLPRKSCRARTMRLS